MPSKAARIRSYMEDSGMSRAEARAMVAFEGESSYTPCAHCADELAPEVCAAKRGVSEVPCLTFGGKS